MFDMGLVDQRHDEEVDDLILYSVEDFEDARDQMEKLCGASNVPLRVTVQE
jgi:hypothetical protein